MTIPNPDNQIIHKVSMNEAQAFVLLEKIAFLGRI